MKIEFLIPILLKVFHAKEHFVESMTLKLDLLLLNIRMYVCLHIKKYIYSNETHILGYNGIKREQCQMKTANISCLAAF